MKKITLTALGLLTITCLAGCGGRAPLTEQEWKYATRQYKLKNSSYSLVSECYEDSSKERKYFTLEEEVKLNEQNLSVVKTKKYPNNVYPDSTVYEFYSLEYGTWTFGSLINGTDNVYVKSTINTTLVEPFVFIMQIFGDTPGQMIGSKFSQVEKQGDSYVYKEEGKELTFTFTEGYKNFDTWYVDVDTVSFKWTRLINGKDYYEEGQVRFFDLNQTTVEMPNEVRMNLFCQDYIVKDKIKSIYISSSMNEEVLSHYLEEDDYSIVSVRELSDNNTPIIYFGGQMSTNILGLPYTVRKGNEIIGNFSRNVFYLDVESDVISDIKCYSLNEAQYVFNEYANDMNNWPITKYTGEGMWNYDTVISFKVNGVEYLANGTHQVSYVMKTTDTNEINKPTCMFYSFEYDLGQIGNTDVSFNAVARTENHIFALKFDHAYGVIPRIESLYTREVDRDRYGKVFFTTKVYDVDVSRIEKNDNGYFVCHYDEGTYPIPYLSINLTDSSPKIQTFLNNGRILDYALDKISDEGIVSHYSVLIAG